MDFAASGDAVCGQNFRYGRHELQRPGFAAIGPFDVLAGENCGRRKYRMIADIHAQESVERHDDGAATSPVVVFADETDAARNRDVHGDAANAAKARANRAGASAL